MTKLEGMKRVRNLRTIVTATIKDLQDIGCTDIKKEGSCWSFTTDDGESFTGGIAVVHQFIVTKNHKEWLESMDKLNNLWK